MSFSICFLYSSTVVAPIIRTLWRARAGFKTLAASRAPSAAPAPIIIWISSIKAIICGCAASAWVTLFSRSSNSPRYFVPAIIRARSSCTICLSCSDGGTSPATMRCARPSTMAVLPTPGSPMSTGLFFDRRLKITAMRLISPCRPMTGSSFLSRARWVISVPNCLRIAGSATWVSDSAGALASAAAGCSRRAKKASKSAMISGTERWSVSASSLRARLRGWLNRLWRICSVPSSSWW